MNRLTYLEGVRFPKAVIDLELMGVISAKDVVFPEVVKNQMILNNLKSVSNVTLPKTVKGLRLMSLPSAKGLVRPEITDSYMGPEDF